MNPILVVMGEPPVPLSPLEIKALVRLRDGYQCVECGLTTAEHVERYDRNLDVHRLVPGSPYTVGGCVTLCKECHRTKPVSPKGSRPKKQCLVSIPNALFEALCAYAEREGRTPNQQANWIVREMLAAKATS